MNWFIFSIVKYGILIELLTARIWIQYEVEAIQFHIGLGFLFMNVHFSIDMNGSFAKQIAESVIGANDG